LHVLGWSKTSCDRLMTNIRNTIANGDEFHLLSAF
jgi:hypothetical protein